MADIPIKNGPGISGLSDSYFYGKIVELTLEETCYATASIDTFLLRKYEKEFIDKDWYTKIIDFYPIDEKIKIKIKPTKISVKIIGMMKTSVKNTSIILFNYKGEILKGFYNYQTRKGFVFS